MNSKRSSIESSNNKLTRKEFALFQDLISDRIGLYYDYSRITSVESALKKRLSALGIPSFSEYYKILSSQDEQDELKRLLLLLTIGETCFFRSPDQFKALKQSLLPEIISTRSSKKIRIWSAGCSTGEEPYSIAIILLDLIQNIGDWDIKIIATDINPIFLEHANKGVYSQRSLRFANKDFGPDITDRYFHKKDGKFAIKDNVKNLISFTTHNLVKEGHLFKDTFDIIMCRNVLIYYDRETFRNTIENFNNALSDDGVLILGYSESLFGITDTFIPLRFGDAFFYKKRKRDAGKKEHLPPRARAIAPVSKEPSQKLTPYEQALRYFKKGDFDSGINLIRETSEDHPLSFLTLGNIYFERNDIAEAINMYQKAVSIKPLSQEAHFLLAISLYKNGKEDNAIEELKRAIYLDKNFAIAHLYIALIHHRRGEIINAKRSYENALISLQKKPEQGHIESYFISEEETFPSQSVISRICKENISDLGGGS